MRGIAKRYCLSAFGAWFLLCGAAALAQALPLAGLPRNATILFQGDSITDGGRARTGNDYNHTMGQDYAYVVSAKLGAEYPDRHLTFINRGIGGDTVLGLALRWQADTLSLKPDILSILIGVNDTLSPAGESAEEFEKTYDKLLGDTLAALPKVKIVLGEPFLLPVGKYKNEYATYMVELRKRQDAVAWLSAKYHLPTIAYQKIMTDACAKAPPDYWSWDGVHPTYAGHGLMAQAWIAVVNQAY